MTRGSSEGTNQAKLRYMNGIAQLMASRGPDLGLSFERAVKIVTEYQKEYERTSGSISGEEHEVRRILRDLHGAEAALLGYKTKSEILLEKRDISKREVAKHRRVIERAESNIARLVKIKDSVLLECSIQEKAGQARAEMYSSAIESAACLASKNFENCSNLSEIARSIEKVFVDHGPEVLGLERQPAYSTIYNWVRRNRKISL